MSRPPTIENLKALTSLRFFAAMMIVVLHGSNSLDWPWLRGAPLSLAQGVSFFFVLSGFILTHVYGDRPPGSILAFMRARVARLWPVHVVGIVLLVVSVAPDSITFDGPGIFSKWVVLGFNAILVHSAFPFLAYTFSWNSVSWSISTEMFFYLAFPFLLVNIERTWHWKLLGAALLAAALIVVLRIAAVPIESSDFNRMTAGYATYPSPLMRGFEFVLGMSTNVLWRKYLSRQSRSLWWWTAVEAIALAVCAWWMLAGFHAVQRQFPNPWFNLFFQPAGSCWAFALAIGCLASGRGLVGRLLSVRPLVFLGEISFSIYMLHLILIKAFVTTFAWPGVPEFVYFGALFVLATTAYLLVEKPAQRLLRGGSKAKMLHPPITDASSGKVVRTEA
ncbi:peptidoglycan/LPS O-acetylase OafA/YrhL [Variovorax boronicumulans]|uniref:acyltransferase family protein n=1 Tax=Variovorax boronicumulans TaxID=436515 RepID=UPI002789A481|nr:acyltransferase family protein [Variovorax boronicumulans]MDQ0034568.1 peptidoglycan/LPS O-acetylase OafA/YrhL [Variovorax boronicumulans]